MASPWGSSSARRNVVPSYDSTPGTDFDASRSSSHRPSNGRRVASRSTIVPGVTGSAPRTAVARRSRGVVAKTARTVSLNCRMLAKPAAKATSANRRSVVSTSTRAVCARWARASAWAPAPTSATSSRCSWRSL